MSMKMLFNIVFITLFCTVIGKSVHGNVPKVDDVEKTSEYWEQLGRDDVSRMYKTRDIEHKAKNVIIFLGDGFGISTVTPSRILKGQLKNESGEEAKLVFEDFPNTCLIKTYNIDYQVPDSAGTATAFLTGVKTNKGVIGVNAAVNRYETDCDIVQKNSVTSIFEKAMVLKKATGIVTTTRVTHATPSAGYASIADRDWEGSMSDESKMKLAADGSECKDIGRQLVEDYPGNSLNVIMGGGARYLYPQNYTDPVSKEKSDRKDDLNLIEKWLAHRQQTGLEQNKYSFVNNRDQLLAANNNEELQYLFGVFNHNHLSYDMERDASLEPSLEDMTESAIRLLQKNDNGLVLLIEGGLIDKAHHDNWANLALHEAVAFDRAIERALQLVDTNETLIVVTADHSHTLTMNGYPHRGDKITGIAEKDEESGKPYTTLMYGNGPGHIVNSERPDPSTQNTDDPRYRSYSAVYMEESNHGGEDVALYSIGPMSHLFRGTKEQNYVAHVMQMAACLGQYSEYDHCKSDNNSSTSLNSTKLSIYLSILLIITFIKTYL